MGVDVIVTRKAIAKLLRFPNSGILLWALKTTVLKQMLSRGICLIMLEISVLSDIGKVKNMKKEFRLLFKILIGCLIPRKGNTDKTSWDHKHFILYLKNEDNTISV